MITVRDMQPYDEMSTPIEALIPLLPYLSHNLAIWEMCPGKGAMVQHLLDANFTVGYALNVNSLVEEPDWPYDVIVTNPPWSKKHLFLERCVMLDAPFALLLPVRTLGVRRCQIWMGDCDFLFLPKRIDYVGKKAPYEASFWVTRHILPERVIFAD